MACAAADPAAIASPAVQRIAARTSREALIRMAGGIMRPPRRLRKTARTGELDFVLMTNIRLACSVMLAVGLTIALGPASREQQFPPAGEQAKRVLDLLVQQKFEDVAKQFNDKMAALLSPTQLGNVWNGMRQQVGAFRSIGTMVVAKPVAGITAVTIGCQFEKSGINLIVAFDENDRIA